MPAIHLQEFSWERMIRAVERVRERLLRATAALEGAGVPYAVIGGNAVAAWVSRVDETAVRNTQDVDILLRRAEFEKAKAALESAGFRYRHVRGIDMFLDGDVNKVRDAVHVIYANERVRPDDLCETPDVGESQVLGAFQAVDLPALVRMKLTSYRLKDQVHIQDFISVGLVDESWLGTLPPALAERLKPLLENPES